MGKKISALPVASALTGDEIIPMDQGTPTTVRATAKELLGIGIPVSEHDDNYTTVLADAGHNVRFPLAGVAGKTFLIAASAAVAWRDGHALTFSNMSSNDLTIDINVDTLYWAQDGTTVPRTLAAKGICTAVYQGGGAWLIAGTGLS